METSILACEERDTRGKASARALRRRGMVPAVLYGPQTAAKNLTLSAQAISAEVAAAARQRLIRLHSEAAELEGKHVILKDVQRSAVSGRILHVDLYEVDLGRTIRVAVPLKFFGRAVGVAAGGILQPLERSVEVECLPLDIPETMEVDVTGLEVHDVLHVSDLSFPANAKPVFVSDYPVVTVLPPTVAEAPAAEAEAAEAAEAPPAEGAPAQAQPAEEAASSGSEGGKSSAPENDR